MHMNIDNLMSMSMHLHTYMNMNMTVNMCMSNNINMSMNRHMHVISLVTRTIISATICITIPIMFNVTVINISLKPWPSTDRVQEKIASNAKAGSRR